MAYREQVRAAVTKAMDAQKLDAFVYPTWSNPPRLIGDLNTPHGDNSQFFSPTTGFPGDPGADGLHARRTLPAGITFFGRAWSEPTLIKLAYAYEQATHHRRPPRVDAAAALNGTPLRFRVSCEEPSRRSSVDEGILLIAWYFSK